MYDDATLSRTDKSLESTFYIVYIYIHQKDDKEEDQLFVGVG